MPFSRSLKSSSQSLPSPNGAYIATILPGTLSVRQTRSLEIIRVISLPPELSASLCWFSWSASSDRALVASSDNIRVFAVSDPLFSATITNPTSGTTRPAFVAFGATDEEILSFSEFGLKLSIFNLKTSKSVDINSPKFYNAGVAQKGYSHRPGSLNLALLTRSDGKDIISVHSHGELEVIRSWFTETIDAQSLSWSSDGRWLAVVESASQGHKVLMYTADGHLYKTWNGPSGTGDDKDLSLGAGIKMFEWNKSGTHVAIGDYNNRVMILAAPSLAESVYLLHIPAVTPADSLQIWQELITATPQGGLNRDFLLATQTICPPTMAASNDSKTDSSTKTGISMLGFDNSGTLLLSRIQQTPTTIWIWDIGTRVLRAVLVLHAAVAKATWHPFIDELLMIRCEGEENRGLVHLWDPSWQTPKIIDFAAQMPGGKIVGKTVARWLQSETSSAAVFFSDTQDCMLAAITEPGSPQVPWQEAEARGYDIYGDMEESPLSLVPADEKRLRGKVTVNALLMEDDGLTATSGSDEVEDTFRFRRFVEP